MGSYCEHCRSEQRYEIRKNKHQIEIEGKTIEFIRKVAICETCDWMIDIPELEDEAMSDIERIYKRKWCN